MSSQRQKQVQILISWVNNVLKTNIHQLIQLWDGSIFHRLLSLVPGIKLRPYKPNPCNVWQLAFTNSKTIYRSIQEYWTKTLNRSWQPHAYIDLLKLSRQRNQDQIIQLLILVFGCCVQSEDDNKDQFIQPIYKFNQIQHGEFMELLHKYKFQERLVGNKVIQIKELMTKVEALEIENDNLEKAMGEQMGELQILQESISYLAEENKKSKEELKASVTGTEHKLGESLTTSIVFGDINQYKEKQKYQDESKKIIDQLKAKAHDDKQNHMRQINQLKETIEFLKETISGNRRDRGVSSRRLSKGITQRIQTDHPPCVSLVKYQQVVFSQTQKMKQIAKKQQEREAHISALQKQLKDAKINEQTKTTSNLIPNTIIPQDKTIPSTKQKVSDAIDYESLKIDILQRIKTNLQNYSRKPLVNNFIR